MKRTSGETCFLVASVITPKRTRTNSTDETRQLEKVSTGDILDSEDEKIPSDESFIESSSSEEYDDPSPNDSEEEIDEDEKNEEVEGLSLFTCMECEEPITNQEIKDGEARDCVINNPTGQFFFAGELPDQKVGWLCPSCFDLGGDYDNCGGCGRASLGICVNDRCRECFTPKQINDLLKKTWRHACIVEMMEDEGVFELDENDDIPYEFFGGEDGFSCPRDAHKIVEEALAREKN